MTIPFRVLLTVSFITVLTCATASAQNQLAIIKYEQAEEFYAKKDFTMAMVRLDEAAYLLKASNPKILHLYILA